MLGNPSFRRTDKKCPRARKCKNCYWFAENSSLGEWTIRCKRFESQSTFRDGLCDSWVREGETPSAEDLSRRIRECQNASPYLDHNPSFTMADIYYTEALRSRVRVLSFSEITQQLYGLTMGGRECRQVLESLKGRMMDHEGHRYVILSYTLSPTSNLYDSYYKKIELTMEDTWNGTRVNMRLI